jgi:biofilm PGA synthesis protein PgaA
MKKTQRLRNLTQQALISFAIVGAISSWADAGYDSLISRARSGEARAVLPELQQRFKKNPEDENAQRDLIVIASWAESHQLAVDTFTKLKSPAPAYVLAAVALSERRLGEYASAIKHYESQLILSPSDRGAQAGLVLSVLERDGAENAAQRIDAFTRNTSNWRNSTENLALIEALAIVRERQGRWTEALSAWQNVRALAPNDKTAARALVFVASRLGAASIADDMAQSATDGIELDARTRLRQDRTAFKIRWGEVDLRVKAATARFVATDTALGANQVDLQHPESKPVYREWAAADRLVALRNRVAMQDAIVLFEQTIAQGVKLPTYATSAAADAYLYERHPQRARDLYLDALAQQKAASGGDNIEWQFSLVYAYIECEQWDEAFALTNTLVDSTRPRVIRGAATTENPDHARALLLRASLHLYADEQRIAKRELDEYRLLAPYNVSALGVQSGWYSANGKTLRAHEGFSRVLTEEPESLGARVGHTESMLGMRRWQDADVAIHALVNEYPESRGVQRLQGDWEMLHSPELRINAGVTRSKSDNPNAQQSTREWQIEATAYAKPSAHSTRLFAQIVSSHGTLANRSTTGATRVGIGVEHQREALNVSAELHRRNFIDAPSDSDVGVALAANYTIDDDWRIRANADSHTADIAFRAIQNGVSARRFGLTVERNFEYARSISLGATRHAFSDGNRRTSYAANWHERPYSAARWKFDTDVSISGSQSSRTDVAYFSPTNDFSAELTVAADWLTWRNYERTFKQQLALTAGTYKQSGYTNKPIVAVSYTQEWSRSRHWGLRYGASWLQRPYDGVQERRIRGFVEFNWRLR